MQRDRMRSGEWPGNKSNRETGGNDNLHGRDAPAISSQSAELRYALLANHTSDLVYTLDASAEIRDINPAVAAYGYKPEDLIGRPFGELIHPDDRSRVEGAYTQMVDRAEDCFLSHQFRLVTRANEDRWLEDSCAVRFDEHGRFLFLAGVCVDTTAFQRAREGIPVEDGAVDVEMRIRAAELMFTNEALQKEILERQETERALRDREIELEREMSALQEANTALKVLLKRREADKHDFEDQVMYNVKELLLPYLDKLKAVASDERQKAYLSILESNLNEITAPFFRRLSIEYFDLTPAEMKVANFIRQGKRSQDMASLLGLSIRTIEAYRLSIRRKMRLQNKKINLRTFLMAIR